MHRVLVLQMVCACACAQTSKKRRNSCIESNCALYGGNERDISLNFFVQFDVADWNSQPPRTEKLAENVSVWVWTILTNYR